MATDPSRTPRAADHLVPRDGRIVTSYRLLTRWLSDPGAWG